MDYNATMNNIDVPVSLSPEPFLSERRQLSLTSMHQMNLFDDHDLLALGGRRESLMTVVEEQEEVMLCSKGALPRYCCNSV